MFQDSQRTSLVRKYLLYLLRAKNYCIFNLRFDLLSFFPVILIFIVIVKVHMKITSSYQSKKKNVQNLNKNMIQNKICT